MTDLEKYYNKFNEEKRLDSRQGQVEFLTSMKYIHEYIELCKKENEIDNSQVLILDIGAGTGRYSVALSNEGYDVSAVELVAYNLGILKAKNSSVKAYKGNALNLKRFNNNSFHITLLFGPMYHLHSYEDKKKALQEAARVTKPGGIILVAYCMNEYSVLTYAFTQKHIKENIKNNFLDDKYKVLAGGNELYDVMRIEDINRVVDMFNSDDNNKGLLTREKIIAADGAATYLRPMLRSLDDEEFEHFLGYHFATCERQDLIGASWHTVDILRVNK